MIYTNDYDIISTTLNKFANKEDIVLIYQGDSQ